MAFLVLLFQSQNCQLKLKCVNFQQPVGCPSRSMYLTPHSPRMASAAGMQPCPQRTPQHPLSPARVPQLNSPHTPQVTLTETKQMLKTLESLLYINWLEERFSCYTRLERHFGQQFFLLTTVNLKVNLGVTRLNKFQLHS